MLLATGSSKEVGLPAYFALSLTTRSRSGTVLQLHQPGFALKFKFDGGLDAISVVG
jgi:hypothetical protein